MITKRDIAYHVKKGPILIPVKNLVELFGTRNIVEACRLLSIELLNGQRVDITHLAFDRS